MNTLEIMSVLSGIVVLGFGLFLIGLAVLIALRPSTAERFLDSFSSSAKAHYIEQGLRLLVAAAIVNFANSMWYEGLFWYFGWLMVVSTVGLLLTPWRWHQRFAHRVMPPVYRRLRLFGLGAAAFGAFILYGLSRAVIS